MVFGWKGRGKMSILKYLLMPLLLTTVATSEASSTENTSSSIEESTINTTEGMIENTSPETTETSEGVSTTTSETEESGDRSDVVPPEEEITPEYPGIPGWYLLEGNWYYYDENGTLLTGWHWMQNNWFYFDLTTGKMATGFQEIGGEIYYFHPRLGNMQKSWQQVDGKWYYFHKNLGNSQVGWQVINKKWYYLDPETAEMQTGWLELGSNKYYLKSSGAMVTGTYTIDNQVYSFQKNGALIVNRVLLGVHTTNQYQAGIPQGCEPASLWASLTYLKKTKLTYPQLVKQMPIASNGNPYAGFGGNPYLPDGSAQQWGFPAMFPKPFTTWASRYTKAKDLTGASLEELKGYLKKGTPVVTWVTVHYLSPWWSNQWFGRTLNNNHAVVLDGFDETTKQVHVADSIDGEKWLSQSQFLTAYNPRKFAVAILP